MAFKEVNVPNLGTVRLYKRRGNRSLKLSLSHDGIVKVTLPAWVPYATALKFAVQKTAWINKQRADQLPPVKNGQSIGKAHRLKFNPDNSLESTRTRVKANEVIVSYPSDLEETNTIVQNAAQTAIRRALKTEAETLLPQRLEILAKTNGFTYNTVSTRYLKSRWGSCDQKKNIVLNIFLMQLPWSLIDYVLLHELTHTRVLHHGPIFWDEFDKSLPNAKSLKKDLQKYQPHAFFNENA